LTTGFPVQEAIQLRESMVESKSFSETGAWVEVILSKFLMVLSTICSMALESLSVMSVVKELSNVVAVDVAGVVDYKRKNLLPFFIIIVVFPAPRFAYRMILNFGEIGPLKLIIFPFCVYLIVKMHAPPYNST
jgi:hypothetical protein